VRFKLWYRRLFYTDDADATATVADGATDPARAMYFKVTSSATLTATRTLTIAPNTVSRLQYIENATTGGQSINISQGSGANVTIPMGQQKQYTWMVQELGQQ
jgi:hypothetical protein